MSPWAVPLLTFAGVVTAGAFTVLGHWLASRAAAKPAQTTADATAQATIQQGFADLVEKLRTELDGARVEVAAARAEILELRGELRDNLQHLDSLERLLQAQGVNVPVRKRSRAAAGLALVLPPSPLPEAPP